ncbi:MAG: hypothetical protein ABSA91_05660, partial [Acidimicrobiales bacterium]
DADDVLGQLIAQAAARALAELRREARSSTPERSHSELAGRSASLRHALEAMRSVDPGPDYVARLAGAERHLLALLLVSPSMSASPAVEKGEATDH